MDAIVNVRTKQAVKNRAQKVFSEMGMNTSVAVNMFLNHVATNGELPFAPKSSKKEKSEK